jgi:hypothetical protein
MHGCQHEFVNCDGMLLPYRRRLISACITMTSAVSDARDRCVLTQARLCAVQWCVQVLPECGSFQKSVHSAIFPAIKKIKQAEDAGQPKSVAIAAAVPGLIEAILKTMGCREMCQAVVDTCSCNAPGERLTFGEALLAAEANNEVVQNVRPLFVLRT